MNSIESKRDSPAVLELVRLFGEINKRASRVACLKILRQLALEPPNSRIMDPLVALLRQCENTHDELKVLRLVYMHLRLCIPLPTTDNMARQELLQLLQERLPTDMSEPQLMTIVLETTHICKLVLGANPARLLQTIAHHVSELRKMLQAPAAYKKKKKEVSLELNVAPAMFAALHTWGTVPDEMIVDCVTGMCCADAAVARAAGRVVAAIIAPGKPDLVADSMKNRLPAAPDRQAPIPPGDLRIRMQDPTAAVYFLRACAMVAGGDPLDGPLKNSLVSMLVQLKDPRPAVWMEVVRLIATHCLSFASQYEFVTDKGGSTLRPAGWTDANVLHTAITRLRTHLEGLIDSPRNWLSLHAVARVITTLAQAVNAAAFSGELAYGREALGALESVGGIMMLFLDRKHPHTVWQLFLAQVWVLSPDNVHSAVFQATSTVLPPGAPQSILNALSRRSRYHPILARSVFSMGLAWLKADASLLNDDLLDVWKQTGDAHGPAGHAAVLRAFYELLDTRSPAAWTPAAWESWQRLRVHAYFMLGQNANHWGAETGDPALGSIYPAAGAASHAEDDLLHFGSNEAAALPPAVAKKLTAAQGAGSGSLVNPVIRSIIVRLYQGVLFEGAEVRTVCIQGLIKLAMRSHDPTRLLVYELLHSLGYPQTAVDGQYTAGGFAASIPPAINPEVEGTTERCLAAHLFEIQPALQAIDAVYNAKQVAEGGQTPDASSVLRRAKLFSQLTNDFSFS